LKIEAIFKELGDIKSYIPKIKNTKPKPTSRMVRRKNGEYFKVSDVYNAITLAMESENNGKTNN